MRKLLGGAIIVAVWATLFVLIMTPFVSPRPEDAAVASVDPRVRPNAVAAAQARGEIGDNLQRIKDGVAGVGDNLQRVVAPGLSRIAAFVENLIGRREGEPAEAGAGSARR